MAKSEQMQKFSVRLNLINLFCNLYNLTVKNISGFCMNTKIHICSTLAPLTAKCLDQPCGPSQPMTYKSILKPPPSLGHISSLSPTHITVSYYTFLKLITQ